MSTRCRIGIVEEDGTVKSIYCHHDGYVKGVGETLRKHYTDPEKIEKLINLGDISILGEEYDSEWGKYYWDKVDNGKTFTPKDYEMMDKMTVTYRDRGEEGIDYRVDKDVEEYTKKAGDCGEEFVYLFKTDYSGVYKWFVMGAPIFVPIEESENEA